MPDTLDLTHPDFLHGTTSGYQAGCRDPERCALAGDPDWFTCRGAYTQRNIDALTRNAYSDFDRVPIAPEKRGARVRYRPADDTTTPRPAPRPTPPSIRPADTVRPAIDIDDVAEPDARTEDTAPEAGDVVEQPEWINGEQTRDLGIPGYALTDLVKDGTIGRTGRSSGSRYRRADVLQAVADRAWIRKPSAGEKVSSPVAPPVAAPPTATAPTSPAEPTTPGEAADGYTLRSALKDLRQVREAVADRDAALEAARARIAELEATIAQQNADRLELDSLLANGTLVPLPDPSERTGGESAPRHLKITAPSSHASIAEHIAQTLLAGPLTADVTITLAS